MVIYADILVLTNLLIDGLLLLSSAALCGCPPCKFWRMLAASLVGGLSSLLILLPHLPWWALLLVRLSTAALMTLTALAPLPPYTYFKVTGIYYGLGLLLTGLLLLADSLFSPSGLYMHNQTAYINLNFWQLLFAAVALYCAMKGVLLWREKEEQIAESGVLTLTFQGRKAGLKALTDSGNLLKDPNSGRPVAVCTLSSLLPLFDSELQAALKEKKDASALFSVLSEGGVKAHLIPYQGVGAEGMLPVFFPEQAAWKGPGPAQAGNWAVGVLPAGTVLAEGFEAVLKLPEHGGGKTI